MKFPEVSVQKDPKTREDILVISEMYPKSIEEFWKDPDVVNLTTIYKHCHTNVVATGHILAAFKDLIYRLITTGILDKKEDGLWHYKDEPFNSW